MSNHGKQAEPLQSARLPGNGPAVGTGRGRKDLRVNEMALRWPALWRGPHLPRSTAGSGDSQRVLTEYHCVPGTVAGAGHGADTAQALLSRS